MYFVVKTSKNSKLIAKEIDTEDLEDDEQCIEDIQTYVNEGALVILIDEIDTLKEFFPNTDIKVAD